MLLSFLFITILVFYFISMAYVYLYRGEARYASISEYLRKGWPIFAPFNCMLYIFTKKRAQRAIMDNNLYPELKEITDNWKSIKQEGLSLLNNKFFDKTTNAKSSSYYDLGFRTFYKYGWSKFYLTWYGHTHFSAKKLCPKTVKIVNKCKSVNGAMFTILPPGSKLTRHLDPIACSLRYHLGLQTPNSNDCYISIDDKIYSWKDGESLLFDETYLHYAHNDTDTNRLILMCDIERPMNIFGKIFNLFYKIFMKFTVVPNMIGDKRGLINTIFSFISPVLKKSKKLKNKNKLLYLLLKYSINITLIALLLFIILKLVRLGMFLVQNL